MKSIKECAFQGDIMITKKDSMPSGVKEAEDKVVAHSETGHHHVAIGNCTKYTTDDPMVSFLVGTGDIELRHLRSFDTHESLNLLNEGEGEVIWEIRRQREEAPEGWRMVQD